jgi:hypothetical protein
LFKEQFLFFHEITLPPKSPAGYCKKTPRAQTIPDRERGLEVPGRGVSDADKRRRCDGCLHATST